MFPHTNVTTWHTWCSLVSCWGSYPFS